MSVIIKLNTGFAGATHEEDTGMSVDEWKQLSKEHKREWLDDMVGNHIEVYAVDEENEDEHLD